MRPIAFLLLLACGLKVSAQRDSLWALIRSGNEDTTAVLHYLDLGMEYELSQPDSAIIIYTMARDLSEKLNYPMGYCKYANAVAYPLELFGRLDEKDSILWRSVDICQKMGYRRELARKYHSLGISDQMRRNYTASADLYLKGMTIVEELKDTAMLTAFYNNLGSVFKGLGQNEKAYQYIDKALSIHRARGRKSGIATAQINLGILDIRSKNYEKALERYHEALQISNELNDIEGIIICHVNMADIYLGQKEIDAALASIAVSDSLSKILESPRYIMLTLQAKASALKLKGDNTGSIDALLKTEVLAKELDEKERLSAIYFDLSENYENTGEFDKALLNYKLFHAYADSVAGEGVENNINELELKFKTAQKERELLAKDLEIEKQSAANKLRGALLIITVVLLLALVLFFIQRQRINNQKLLNVERASQLETLQSREKERTRIAADMHDDLGSGLTSIKLLSEIALRNAKAGEEHKELSRISEKSNELVHKMSEIIWAMNPDHDTLANLVAYIRSYAARFLDEAQFTFSFDEKLQNPEKQISGEFRRNVFLIIKEALNNAVKYSQGNAVHILLNADGEGMQIEIRDNGTGISSDKIRIGSQGITGMQKRAISLGGQVSIIQDDGTTIRLQVPIKYT
ncbi:MAG: tetratricopeptide repeat protein [Flavobacteriales bacterium]